jgi:hypothetical protein
MAWRRKAGSAALPAHEKAGRGVRDPVGFSAARVKKRRRIDVNDG